MKNLWREMNEFLRKKYIKPILVGLLTILLVPLVVSFLMESPLMNWGSQKAESWMSFWGGYLGAILGIIGAITATTLQIKSQTNQIVIAAKENDKLERKRINLNLKIEKNVELFKIFVELKSTLLKYNHIANELIFEQENLIDNYIKHASALEKLQSANIERNIYKIVNNKVNESDEEIKESEIKFSRIDEIVDKNNEKISLLKNELNQISSSLHAISTDIMANIIFIDENYEYSKIIEKYIDIVQNELFEMGNYTYYEDVADLYEFLTNRAEKLNYNYESMKELDHSVSYSYRAYMKHLVSQIEDDISNDINTELMKNDGSKDMKRRRKKQKIK
ncbi:hypothetical protein [Exiguobacterium sp. s138]|uniref:hypothetical protein n=1 Tax=Exiguobacterium sp. s138 TaxID=2751202 RepID=UPI001BECC6FF|nr:hypothetical protein [Exiguobacterium sp. s138]